MEEALDLSFDRLLMMMMTLVQLVDFTIEIIPVVILARGTINLTRGFSGFSLGYFWRKNLNYTIILHN